MGAQDSHEGWETLTSVDDFDLGEDILGLLFHDCRHNGYESGAVIGTVTVRDRPDLADVMGQMSDTDQPSWLVLSSQSEPWYIRLEHDSAGWILELWRSPGVGQNDVITQYRHQGDPHFPEAAVEPMIAALLQEQALPDAFESVVLDRRPDDAYEPVPLFPGGIDGYEFFEDDEYYEVEEGQQWVRRR